MPTVEEIWDVVEPYIEDRGKQREQARKELEALFVHPTLTVEQFKELKEAYSLWQQTQYDDHYNSFIRICERLLT